MSDLFLGIDVGTYASKGVLVTAEGELVDERATDHDLDVPHPGWAEQDVDAVW